MNLKTIGIIIRREYLNKVRKKSFLLTTLLVPVLVGGGMIALIAIMLNTSEQQKKVAVVDRSGIVMPTLENSETVEFVDYSGFDLDSVKANLGRLGLDAVLSVSDLDSANRTVTSDITSLKPLGMDMAENVNNQIDDAVEQYRIETYGIAGLDRILQDVKTHVKLNAYTIGEDGKESVSETGVYAIFSMLLGIIIFLFVTLFGSMVMSAVIEEKSSRVVEVLVSSVKATELMFGKIIGIALVALTQFLLWIALTAAILGVAGRFIGTDLLAGMESDPTEMMSTLGVDASQMAGPSVEDTELSVILTTVKAMPLVKIAVVFMLFFLFGYMLYASLFAAIGSAVENEGDSQQLQLPLTVPLMIAYIIALYAFKAPDSSIAFWGSMIPFTSPIVMIARLPFGVPFWELATSLAVLVLTFALCAWASAKIYKVGILMFGKKSTWKDLWKWLKQN